MRPDRHLLLKPYQAALSRFIKQGTDASLKPARRLGQRAVAMACKTLELALIHEQAVVLNIAASLPLLSKAEQGRIIKRAGKFFAEALLPMETTHRTAITTASRLKDLNRSLINRTKALSYSNRKLSKEIVKRRTIETALRNSESQSVRLLQQSKHLQHQLKLLSRRVLSAQEEERKRISRELHDVIAQMLTGINIRLTILKKEAASNTGGITGKINRAQRLVEKSVEVVHRFARELRPAVLDDLGLIPALQSFLKSFAIESGLSVKLTASPVANTLGTAKRTALYRIALESLTNIVRHANANQVKLSLRAVKRMVTMRIQDNGSGFDVNKMWHGLKTQHLGMLGMQERVEMVGGHFSVKSALGQGTTILVSIPLTKADTENPHA